MNPSQAGIEKLQHPFLYMYITGVALLEGARGARNDWVPHLLSVNLRIVQKIDEAPNAGEPCGVGSRGPLMGPGGGPGAKPPKLLCFFLMQKQPF